MNRQNDVKVRHTWRYLGLTVLGLITRAVVRPYRAKTPPTRAVAIVVPMSERQSLLADEEQSIRHLSHYLGSHDKYLVVPAGVSVERQGFRTVCFPRKFFGSAAAHNRLLMWPRFYRTFDEYQYILIYHLDSLAFADDLLAWCRAGWDYIGAPWIPCDDTPWVKEPRVGNGGFTLMKIESILRVLRNRYRQKPDAFWTDMLTRNGPHLGLVFRLLERLHRRFPDWSIASRPLAHWRLSEDAANRGRNNDYFWSFHAKKYLPDFSVASVEEGLRFAFEAAPRLCFELNGRRLPFGCHAWTKFDRAFWEPHLLSPQTGGAPVLAGQIRADMPSATE